MTDTHTILANPTRSASIAAAAASTASSDQQQPPRSAALLSHSDMQTSAMGSYNGKIPDSTTPKMPSSSSSSPRPSSVRDNGDSSVDGDGESCNNASPFTTTTTEQQLRRDQSAELEADPSILEALKGKDRLYVLKLGEQMEALIRDRRPRVDLAPATSYHRLLVHRCCAYYRLTPEPDPTTKSISALLTPESTIPVRKIKDLVPQEAPAQPTFKIMRRSPSQRQRHKTRSQSGSTAGEDGDLSDVEPSETSSAGGRSSAGRKQMTIEEREAAYNEARSRIFMDFAAKEREKEKDMSAGSSTFSLLSGSASTSNAGSVGDFDDLGSSPTTESEWSGPVTRERFEGRNRGSRNHSSNSSQRSLRSNGPPFSSSNGSSSRNSRTASPSVHYASLYEAPPAAPYDHHAMQPYPAQYYYPYPPPPSNQVAPQGYMVPYPYYHPYGYPPHHPPPPPAQAADPNAPNGENVYHPPPPPPPPPPMPMYNHYPWPSSMPPPPPGQPGASPSPGSTPEQSTPQAYHTSYMPPSYPYPVSYYPMPAQPVPLPPGGSTGVAQNSPPVLYNPNDPTRSGPAGGAASSVRSSPAPANRHAVRTPSGSGNGNANGNKRAAPPPARAAWSYGPGVGIGGFPSSVSGVGETVGPRLSSVRRSSMASSSGSGSTGQRTPGSTGGDEASSTSSSTTSSSSRRTYTSTTSSQHPLPARPDWAVGLKPQSPRHHDHRMSPARNGLNLPSSLSHPPTTTNSATTLVPGATSVNLQSIDFPPLSTINSTSAPEKKTPVVSGAWTNPVSARTIMASNGATSGSALVPQRMASNGAMPPEGGRSINGNSVGKTSSDNYNNKANDKEKDKARGEAVASAILLEPMASMTIGVSNGSNLAASDAVAAATAPPTLSTMDGGGGGGGGGGVQPGAAVVPVA